MKIRFQSVVYPVDPYCGMVFTAILNLLLLSSDVVELNRLLLSRNAAFPGLRLSGYFRWEYTPNAFTLWQRMDYGCPDCFPVKVLELPYTDIAKSPESKN